MPAAIDRAIATDRAVAAEPVAITGLGAITPLGAGTPAYIAALRAGRSGVRALPFTHRWMRATVAADVFPDRFDPAAALSEADLRRVPRLVPMALAAAREALAQAGLADLPDPAARRVGLVLGTGGGGIDFTLDQYALSHDDRRPSLWTITNATHGNLAGELSIRLGLRGPSWCVSTGCASSSDAAGIAFHTLRAQPAPPSEDQLDAIVVVGADAHVRWETISSMELLGVISVRPPAAAGLDPAAASRPFDALRDGFVLGEGAWAVVLERPESAAARGRPALGHFLGYAATCDAFHRVRPDPEMREAVRAIHAALRDAAVPPADVALLHYHGTGTPLNDSLETAIVKTAFGPHAPRLVGCSVKGAIGHPQGASGLAALVATLGAATNQDANPAGPFAPPTINLTHPDPACDLDYTPLHPRPLTPGPHVAVVNCLAFGAKNSAMVVRS